MADGAIVALDQEKAYDKIKHDYLWAALDKFNLPQTFIRTVKALYQNAHTQVAINGILSQPFQVTRGVRQGDPLSCALFDIAIEPLACRLRNDLALKGINIPGINEKLIINLFADDTTLYLNKDDRMDDAQQILDEWCTASGAKFNMEKTEIIPLGSEEHRSRVIKTRKINPRDSNPLDEKIRIANDGTAIRSLGAWIGNKTNAETPWEPIIDKTHKALKGWSKLRPTLRGRKLIVQIIFGGYTQFLTKAQGMPQRIEDTLTKMIRDFMWEESTNPKIALDILHRPIKAGGLNLLDLNARNEAIEITWLKTYLDLSNQRPMWAKLVDILIDAVAPPNTNPQVRINTFLQSWNPPMRGNRATRLNGHVMRMLKVARKYGLTFTAIRLSPHLKTQLPAWYHTHADHRPMRGQTAVCLIRTHHAKTVADLLGMLNRIRNEPYPYPHIPSQWCLCRECVHDRTKGCKKPHACANEALEKIRTIYPVMNPLYPNTWHGNLSLTSSRKRMNSLARSRNDAILFDPSITSKNNLSECFRIFVDPNIKPKNPARRRVTPGTALRHLKTTIHTDGASLNNGKMNARCGSGVWFAQNDPRNSASRIPGEKQSNQIGELAAAIIAIQATPPFGPLEIVTDSKYVIDGLTVYLQEWEDQGWIGTQNAPLFQSAAYLLRQRTATTTFKWVKGHQGNIGNEESDKLAREGAEKEIPDRLNLNIAEEFNVQGAKLLALNQAIAYQGIRSTKEKGEPPCASELLDSVRHAIETFNGMRETNETIWQSTLNTVLRTRVQQYLYKSLHQTQMIGSR